MHVVFIQHISSSRSNALIVIVVIFFFFFFASYHNRINKKKLENLNKRYKWDAIDHAPFHYAWHNRYDNHGG